MKHTHTIVETAARWWSFGVFTETISRLCLLNVELSATRNLGLSKKKYLKVNYQKPWDPDVTSEAEQSVESTSSFRRISGRSEICARLVYQCLNTRKQWEQNVFFFFLFCVLSGLKRSNTTITISNWKIFQPLVGQPTPSSINPGSSAELSRKFRQLP